MENKLRSVNTRFWQDAFIEELTPNEKLLFLYLLTNPLSTLIGIYEITTKRISYDTGLPIQTITKAFERFAKASKVFYIDGYIILPNFLKNQNLNPNMKKAVETGFNQLPRFIKKAILGDDNDKDNNDLDNGYETIRNGLVSVREIEGEREGETKGKSKAKTEVNGNAPARNFDKEIVTVKSHYRTLWHNTSDISEKDLIESIIRLIEDERLEAVCLKPEHPTNSDVTRWVQKYTTNDVLTTVRAMENSPKSFKDKKSMRLTLNNWLARE